MKDTILKTYKHKRYHTVKIDTPNEFGMETSHLYSHKDADNGIKIICGVNCTDAVTISKEDSYRNYKDIEVGDTVMVVDDTEHNGEVHTVTSKGMAIQIDSYGGSYLKLQMNLGRLTKRSSKVKKI